MPTCVLDSSAVLAMLFEEPGAEQIEARFRGAAICSVNYSEIVAKLAERGTPGPIITETLSALNLDVRAFDASQAEQAGLLRNETRDAGLSLGDRCCLALALELDCPAVTTDRAWAKVRIGIPIEVAR